MGNAPSESSMGDRLRCMKCDKVLPPCVSFSDLYQTTIHGRYVHVFNGGQYYRSVGHNSAYKCENCFNKMIRDEEERQKEEERRREQERAKEAEEQRREELNERLEQSHQKAEEQHETQHVREMLEKRKTKQRILKGSLADFDASYESDEFLEILSSKCQIPVSSLSLAQLTADQMGGITSALDELLFDEWISAPPSLLTLQHTQVFITELCVLSLEITEGFSLHVISNHVQSLLGSISQSACNVSETFLLTQALYLNLMHFFPDNRSCDSNATLIAKQWAEGDLSNEHLFLIEFLGTLMSSLENTVERTSMFILKMEIQCLKLLLSILTHQNGKESHSECTEMLLRFVQTNQWTPTEALTLLKVLSEKYAEDAAITEVLTLLDVYDISPEWTDDSGHSLIQTLNLIGPERFRLDFQKTLKEQDERSLTSALTKLKQIRNLDDSVVDMIENITTGVLQYSKNVPKDELFMKNSFKCANLNANDIQNSLSLLCKAVFDTKGWWPTVQQMLRWCVLVLTEKSVPLQLVGMEEDPCVTAMFAATQVCRGNKVDIVLTSDRQIKEWSDFYEHLGISLNTNMKKTTASYREVYEADIVYGTMDNFVSDYLQYGLEVMKTGNPHFSRGFMIEEGSLSASHNLELSRLKEDVALVFAAEILQSAMGNFCSVAMELRQRFIKALFRVLHTNPNRRTDADTKIITISQKCTRKEMTSNEVYILTILENVLEEFAGETDIEKNRASLGGQLCLETLFACAVQFQPSKKQTKELFQMVSNAVAQQLWSPKEALNLLVALTDHHHDEDLISIMKILHLIETYQVSSEWTDEKNQSLIELLNSSKTENVIQLLEKILRDEKKKSIDCLFDEIRRMKNIDEPTLEKSYCIVTTVKNLIESGEIKNHTDIQQAMNRSHSTDTEDLQEILAVLCNAVHLHRAKGNWWPRATQMISWCLLVLSDTGKLLEMGTGEGKSCVISMFAALRAFRGEKVDVVSSSSLLCQRDAEKWTDFYRYFGITVDTNTNKTKDEEKKECYQKDVVYGTIEAFAADHLRQIFEMKDVRTDRSYQCIIIDEVDSLLLDHGVQLTYLSSPMVSMQHLNIILAMIWSHVSQYGLVSTRHQTFVRGLPASFSKAIFDSTDIEGINDPMDILCIAEESKIVPEGFTEDVYKCKKDDLLRKLKTVSQDAVIDFFHKIEEYVPCGFTVYTLDDNGLLCLRKASPYNNQDIPENTFLVLEEGLCCPLYDSEEILIKPIAEFISQKIQYTSCTNTTDKISIPGFLRNLIEKKLSVWVQNAFLAMKLREGREYVVENESVYPVDFRSTGIVELSKKWGDGLQQFVEIKHQIKLSTISTVTNYISNISFFEKYHGKIYGTTGTLGNETDVLFLQDLYPNLSACKMPTFNRKKLFEVKGTLTTSAEKWISEIKDVVMAQISPNSYREGRAALVICQSINAAKELYEELKSIIPGQIILYCRSDKDSLSKIDKTLDPGDVIVATNLAGRGTDIKVSEKVNNNGGLFVILSFLSENTRVELQAFGRTARKGKPGSAQVIMTTDHLQGCFRTVSSLEEAKETRNRLAAERINDMMGDITEMKLQEDLFSEYCETLQDLYSYRWTGIDEQRAVVEIMNEFWGIWLQTKSEEIDQLKRYELQRSLRNDLYEAQKQCRRQSSPCSSIYHYIKFGNIALNEKKWSTSMRLFEKAMEQDEIWAAIAFYSHAYCTIKQQRGDYLTEAINNLRKAQDSLKYLSEECIIGLQFVKMSNSVKSELKPTSLEKQLTTRCNMLSYFDKNISEAIKKLDEIKNKGRDAKANKSPMFSLVSSSDEDLQVEAYNLYNRGLKYVFSVEEEPRFPWESLVLFCLGALQIVGGILLTVFTCGTLAQVGIGLITEGISDWITVIESLVTGKFSWEQWATEKAISIGVSLIGFGVGKLVAKGFKVSKLLIKGFGKQLKAMPKLVSTQTKNSLTFTAKTNMKKAVKHTAKSIAEELIIYGFGKAEEKLLNKILDGIKNDVKKRIIDDVESHMEKEPLAAAIDSVILSHLEDKQQFSDLLLVKERKTKLVGIFRELTNTVLKPFYADLSWQESLHSSINTVIDSARSEASGKTRGILRAIQVTHMGALAGDAVHTVHRLSSRFFSNFNEQLFEFQKEEHFSEKVKRDELSATETETLKEFKSDLAETVSALIASALVDVFHQKFSSHLVHYAQDRFHGVLSDHVRTGLKSDRTEEELLAGQNSTYTANMSGDPNSKHTLAEESGEHSKSHAEKIKDPTTAGTVLDIKILTEATGTKVVILIQDSHGKLTKMQELNPDTKPVTQTVTLAYRPKSSHYAEGYYNVCINNKTVTVINKDKSGLFHTLARGMKPDASEEEITLEAHRLRSVEADTLLRSTNQWENDIIREKWKDTIIGWDQGIAEGDVPRKIIQEQKEVLKETVGRVRHYQYWRRYSRKMPDIQQFINTHQQPPVRSILDARKLNQNSKLAEAMLEVATDSLNASLISNVRKHHGPGLPTESFQFKFFSMKKKVWASLAATISKDDVVGVFQQIITGSIPIMIDLKDMVVSKSRLKTVEKTYQQHSKELVEEWFHKLRRMRVMTRDHYSTLNLWIDNEGYRDQNDSHKNQVSKFQ